MQILAYMITLRPHTAVEAFKAYLDESVKNVRGGSTSENVESLVYWPATSHNQCVWLIRFDDEEYDRVSRANWPFIISQIRDVLVEVRQKFAGDITAFSGPTISLEQLADQWNERFGRFSKISL